MRTGAAWLGLCLLVGCVQAPGYHCIQNDQCAPGLCESTGYCSRSDSTCTSGRRYQSSAGALASLCVEADAGTPGALVLQRGALGTVETLSTTSGPLRLSDDGIELTAVSCNSKLCIVGGIGP